MPVSQSGGSLNSTDSSLLRRAVERQPKAWEQLLDVYGPIVYVTCRRGGLQPADAGDVLQEVLAAVAQGLASFENRGPGSFRAWLRAITRHKIQDHWRRTNHGSQSAGGTSAAARLAEVPAPDEPLREESRNDASVDLVQAALELLRREVQDHTWQAFWRTTMAEQSASDVAASLGMKVGAVYQAKSRSLIRLRELVRRLESEKG